MFMPTNALIDLTTTHGQLMFLPVIKKQQHLRHGVLCYSINPCDEGEEEEGELLWMWQCLWIFHHGRTGTPEVKCSGYNY